MAKASVDQLQAFAPATKNRKPVKAITVEITRLIDESTVPILVECLLVDAQNQVHRFIEKDPVDRLPVPRVLACEIESEWVDPAGRSLVRASTVRPCGIANPPPEATFSFWPRSCKMFKRRTETSQIKPWPRLPNGQDPVP